MRTRTATCLCLALAASSAEAYAQDGLLKGPWIMDVRGTSAVIMVERARVGPVTVVARPLGDDAGAAVASAEGPPAALQEVRLTGLRPGTRYGFTVEGPGISPAVGSFATAPEASQPFRFVIYGDTRSHRAPHRAVVEAIVREAPEFVIHTGDLVEDGRRDGLWQEFFDIEAPLLRRTFFAPVIGNHEIAVLRSRGIEQYRRYVHVTPDGPSPELDHSFRWGCARFVLANSYDDWTREARQWLDSELARARAEGPNDWLFVVTHWGPRSSGPHGDNELMREGDVDAILRRHRVDLVVSGHDHAYERGADRGLRYMVSGGGGAPLYPRDARRDMTIVYAPEHHYVRVDVDRAKVRFTTLRPDGTTIDEAELTHDGWRPIDDRRRPDAGVSPPPPPPEGPPEDFSWVWKALPVVVVFAGVTWWVRRRSRGQ